MTIKKKNCSVFEELIIKMNIEELTNDERILLEQHMLTCCACQRLHDSFSFMQEALDVSSKSMPEPDPAIRRRLLNEVKALESQVPSLMASLVDTIFSAIKRPIPLYQAVIAVVLAIIVTFAGFNIDGRLSSDGTLCSGRIQPGENIPEQNIFFKGYQGLGNQRIGINAAEDTSFTSVLFTVM